VAFTLPHPPCARQPPSRRDRGCSCGVGANHVELDAPHAHCGCPASAPMLATALTRVTGCFQDYTHEYVLAVDVDMDGVLSFFDVRYPLHPSLSCALVLSHDIKIHLPQAPCCSRHARIDDLFGACATTVRRGVLQGQKGPGQRARGQNDVHRRLQRTPLPASCISPLAPINAGNATPHLATQGNGLGPARNHVLDHRGI
jgi:hypothetical protein